MASGSVSDPSLYRDSTKKKRINGSAKLKQIKLDVRREQWLSRVQKGSNVDSNVRVDHCPSSQPIVSEENGSTNKENRRKRGENIEGSCIQGNDLGSLIHIPVQSTFDQEFSNSLSGGSSGNDSMSTSFSGNTNEEEEEDDECLDDWETVADALNVDDNLHSVASETPIEHEMQHSCAVPKAAKNPKVDISKTEFRSSVPESQVKCQAWRPDDALRPQCLPNLSKQHSSPLSSVWHRSHKTIPWAWQTIISQCPICYEDLDVTDSSFLPCSCGFRLCLFCHKKILEADGRCPGCRKLYDHADGTVGFNIGAKAFHITQSCSMSTGC